MENTGLNNNDEAMHKERTILQIISNQKIQQYW